MTTTCECCGRTQADERDWTTTRRGGYWCPDCMTTLLAALQVELDALPEQLERGQLSGSP
jgi:hypothetical protein